MDSGRGRELDDAGRKGDLAGKVYAGQRLTRGDGIALYESDDLMWLGRLAHHKRTALNGSRATFVVVRHLDLTDARAVPVTDVAARIRDTAEPPTEVRLHRPDPHLAWSHYPELVRVLKGALPGIQLTGFTAAEVRRFAAVRGRPVGELIDELVDAGLDSLTDDAGIFDREARWTPVDGCPWREWSEIQRLAHAKGLRTTCTMRYGRGEQAQHRIDHVLRLRELQDETGGFAAFVAVRHRSGVGGGKPDRAADHGDMADRPESPPASPAMSLKTFAVSRLLLDNVPHVTCCRRTHAASVAQLALNFGVDDLGGGVAAGADEPGEPRADVLSLIWDADFQPVERDALHRVVREHDDPPSLAERRAEPQRIWA